MQPAHHIESSFAKFGEQKYHPLSSKVMQTSIILYSFLWNLVISVKCSAFHGEFIGFSSIFAGNLWCQDHGHMSKVGSRGVDGVEKKIKSSLNIWTDALRVEGGQTCQRMQGWWVGLEKAVDWGGPTIWDPVSRTGTSLKKKITPSSDSNPIMAIGNKSLFIFFLFFDYENISFEKLFLILQVGPHRSSSSRKDWDSNQEPFQHASEDETCE